MTYNLTQITTTYDRFGNVKHQSEHAARSGLNFNEALAAFNGRNRGVPSFPTNDTSYRYVITDALNGAKLSMEDLYRSIIGERAFRRQINDAHFAINLDTFIAHYVVTHSVDEATAQALLPSAAVAIRGLNAMFG